MTEKLNPLVESMENNEGFLQKYTGKPSDTQTSFPAYLEWADKEATLVDKAIADGKAEQEETLKSIANNASYLDFLLYQCKGQLTEDFMEHVMKGNDPSTPPEKLIPGILKNYKDWLTQLNTSLKEALGTPGSAPAPQPKAPTQEKPAPTPESKPAASTPPAKPVTSAGEKEKPKNIFGKAEPKQDGGNIFKKKS